MTTRIFNPLAMATGMSGSETLTVTRRSSQTTQRIPVITIVLGGTRYLVSTRGESQWVKNVRANPTVTLTTRGNGIDSGDYIATEIPVDQRAPVLDAYRARLGKMVAGYFESLPDAADHPVFTLTPV